MKKKRELILREDGCYDVPLTKGFFAIVDAEDAEMVGQHNWCASVRRNGDFMAVRRQSGGRAAYLHRVIVFGSRHDKEPLFVDHANRDTLDCRRSNLRPATREQNTVNGKPHGKIKLRGVSFVTRRNVYVAQIRWQGKRQVIGYFDDADDAARAYDKAARSLHGEFAAPNFPEDHA